MIVARGRGVTLHTLKPADLKHLHQRLFTWLGDNRTHQKLSWPRWKQNGGDIGAILFECFACFHAYKIYRSRHSHPEVKPYPDLMRRFDLDSPFCYHCPIDWLWSDQLPCTMLGAATMASLLFQWNDTPSKSPEFVELTDIIINLKWRFETRKLKVLG